MKSSLPRRRPPGRAHELLIRGTALLSLAWAIGRLAGDGNLWTGLLFYIPTPVVVVLCLLTALMLGRERRRLAWVAGIWALGATALWSATEIRWSRPDPAAQSSHSPNPAAGAPDPSSSEALTLVHWNVFRGHLPWRWKIERLRGISADIFVLNELPRQVSRGEWALKLGPGMDYSELGQLMVACRGEVSSQKLETYPGLVTLWVGCRIDQQVLSILAVDMAADPTMARNPVLARLVALIDERQPDLIAGDFNAPRRSRQLQTLPRGYLHAYEAVGAGWPYSWPMPLPLLAIDQCITGPRIWPLEHRYVSTLASDHRLQILSFTLRHFGADRDEVKIPPASP